MKDDGPVGNRNETIHHSFIEFSFNNEIRTVEKKTKRRFGYNEVSNSNQIK